MKRKAREALIASCRIIKGKHFRLGDHDPARTDDVDEATAVALLAERVAHLSKLQGDFYAAQSWALLAVFQAIDAGGKDGTIRHVLSGVNPQGIRVTSFKQPGPVALSHDFLWRVHAALPERGMIGVFNRSHYEEVLVARLHPAVLDAQKLPETLRHDRFWKHRYEDIRNFERYVARQGTVPLKFFLHISKAEQCSRLLARLDEKDKHWKFSASDLAERARWDEYQDAYERAISETATPEAPWFVVPADHKWFARLVVVETMIEAIEAMDLKTPEPADNATLEAARRQLRSEC